MREVTIDRSALPRGYYAAHVAERGHEPRVLSGAELRGRARNYGAWYASVRDRVSRAVRPSGVTARLVLDPVCRRRVVAWVDAETGERVRIRLV